MEHSYKTSTIRLATKHRRQLFRRHEDEEMDYDLSAPTLSSSTVELIRDFRDCLKFPDPSVRISDQAITILRKRIQSTEEVASLLGSCPEIRAILQSCHPRSLIPSLLALMRKMTRISAVIAGMFIRQDWIPLCFQYFSEFGSEFEPACKFLSAIVRANSHGCLTTIGPILWRLKVVCPFQVLDNCKTDDQLIAYLELLIEIAWSQTDFLISAMYWDFLRLLLARPEKPYLLTYAVGQLVFHPHGMLTTSHFEILTNHQVFALAHDCIQSHDPVLRGHFVNLIVTFFDQISEKPQIQHIHLLDAMISDAGDGESIAMLQEAIASWKDRCEMVD